MRAVVPNAGYTYTARAPRDLQDLADWLADTYEHSDRAAWTARVLAGEVRVDGVVATPGPVRAGAVVTWERPPWEEPEVPRDWRLVHEDDDLLVVDKPSGLPTMPAGGYLEHTLMAFVQARWADAIPAHRLGRGTSGLVVFARSERARSALPAALREGRVDKRYRARADGSPAWDTREITVPIGPVAHPRLGSVFAASPEGRPACSVATVLARGDTSLLAVRIFTGRPHQIRIHLASVGHPLTGDPLYGPGGAPRTDALPGDVGYLLHAERLAFAHPAGREVVFEAKPPPGLR